MDVPAEQERSVATESHGADKCIECRFEEEFDKAELVVLVSVGIRFRSGTHGEVVSYYLKE